MRARLVCLTAIFMMMASPAAAAPEDVATDVAKEIMSPYCPGATLHDCPSQNAIELRDEIAGWAANGMTKAEIMTRLEEEYGPSIRAVPRAEGSGLFAWLLPGLAIALGGAVGYSLVKRWTSPPGSDEAPTVVSDEERRQVEQELMKLRGEP